MKKSYIIIGIIVALVIVAIVCFAIYNNRIKDNTKTVEPTSQEENNTEQNIVSNEENEESEVNDMYSSGTHHAQIVDKICEDTQVEDSNGTVLKENQPVIEKITMID